MQKQKTNNVSLERNKYIFLQLNKIIHIAYEKQIIKCKNHFSVFIANKLIIKTTKAVK